MSGQDTIPVVLGTEASPANKSSDSGPPAFRDSNPGLVSVSDPGIHAAPYTHPAIHSEIKVVGAASGHRHRVVMQSILL